MKNILLVLSFLFILNLGYSQNSDFKKNEISVGIINLADSPKSQDVLFENSYYFVPFSNLTFKRFLNEQNAIRFTYYRPINKSNEKPPDNWNDNSEYKELVFKLGYEYVFKQKVITPYLALDISYLKSKSSRFSGGGITALYNETESKINGIGLSPALGIHYKINKNIFIGLESNLTIFNLKEEKTSSQWSEILMELNEPKTRETDNFVDYVFNPVVFLVKVKF